MNDPGLLTCRRRAPAGAAAGNVAAQRSRRSLYGRALALLSLTSALGGCAALTPERTVDHPGLAPAPPPLVFSPAAPPPRARAVIDLPPDLAEGERFSVVAHDMPVRELLFSLARDAQINLDLAPEVTGTVSLHAVNEPLASILQRITTQLPLRCTWMGGAVRVEADLPYTELYVVDYVNLSRETDTTVGVATQVATTGTGLDESNAGSAGPAAGNASSTRLETRSYHRFWDSLEANLRSLLDRAGAPTEHAEPVVINAEAGVVSVHATAREQAKVAAFITQTVDSARRQVLIEATIVEVTLNDHFQAGVDWALLLEEGAAGFSAEQKLLGQITDGVIDNAISTFTLGYVDPDLGANAVSASVRLLQEFGEARVLSSPRLMVLNNQTAVLKVVEELVYFTLDVTDKDSTSSQQGRTYIESEIHSVPVGLVMAVTPQVSSAGEVTLTLRPTISQKVGEALDPGTQLAAEMLGADRDHVTSSVPIIRVRELESVLRLAHGQIGVLGGLMQEETRRGRREVPGLARLPLIGPLLFDTREGSSRKTELVIFVRPLVSGRPMPTEGRRAGAVVPPAAT